MQTRALPYVLLLGSLFGTTIIASRFSVGQWSPTTYLGLRLSIAAFAWLLIVLARGNRQPEKNNRHIWRHAMLLGIFDTALPMTFFVLALQYLSSGVTAILSTLGPVVTVVLANFFLPDEPLTWRKAGGIATALAGALLLTLLGESGLPDAGRANPIGYLFILVAISCISVMTIYTRRYVRECDGMRVTAYRTLVAALIVMPLSLLAVGFDTSAVTWQGYLALGYATIFGTFLAILFVLHNIRRFGATASAMTDYVTPVVASLGGVLILDEAFTAGTLAGLVMIVGGVALLNRSNRKPAPDSPLT